jgi:hypothetical protein
MTNRREIFSFHLVRIPFWKVPYFVFTRLHQKRIPGLRHSEGFFTMNLGESIVSPPRYNLKTFALFAWWSDEKSLEEFLQQPAYRIFNEGWHVRMKLYRVWGEISELKTATLEEPITQADVPVVAVTLARLNLFQTHRFIAWGKPVESQVRNHHGTLLALASFRPLNTFSTFSIWKNESEMINMVRGSKPQDGDSHKLAMQERNRKDFHHEFTTMRFIPFKEMGVWNGKSGYCLLK